MKLGILTFHSQLNYGGVLQCWALKTALEGMGHEVVVVDRWMSPDNSMLNGPFTRFRWREWTGILIRSLAGCGTWQLVLRHWRTRKFVRALGLTDYHFYEWRDAPRELGVDCLVVGSDQIWHGGNWGFPSPEPYLLVGAPQVKAIAYAASFGLRSLPAEYDYVAGFNRFSAISVREEDGISLVADAGYSKVVRRVLDPTLLLGVEAWNRIASRKKISKRLVCYLLDEDINGSLPVIEEWARQHQWTVHVVSNGFTKKFPKTGAQLLSRVREMLSTVGFQRVKIVSALGPREFVREFAQADAVITDSFHAVAFSILYGVDCRFLRPTVERRMEMFSRIKSMMKDFIRGAFLVSSLSEALNSLQNGERISYCQERILELRNESAKWLAAALKES